MWLLTLVAAVLPALAACRPVLQQREVYAPFDAKIGLQGSRPVDWTTGKEVGNAAVRSSCLHRYRRRACLAQGGWAG